MKTFLRYQRNSILGKIFAKIDAEHNPKHTFDIIMTFNFQKSPSSIAGTLTVCDIINAPP